MRKISAVFYTLFFLSFFNLQAQNFWGNRGDHSSNIIKEAPAPDKGRELTLGGRLSPQRKIEHSITVSGVVNKVMVNVSDRIIAGTNLLEIYRNVVGESYLPVYLESRIYGVVSEISVYEQQEVKSGTIAVTIIDDRRAVLKAKVSDRDAWDLRTLSGAKIIGESPDGVKITGIIESVSEEPDYETGLFEVRITFPRQKGLYLGMLLFVDVSMGGNGGIPVESSSIVNIENSLGLWVISPDNFFEFRLVSVAGDGDIVTIISGLKQGERYLVRPRGLENEGLTMGEYMEAIAATRNSRSNN